MFQNLPIGILNMDAFGSVIRLFAAEFLLLFASFLESSFLPPCLLALNIQYINHHDIDIIVCLVVAVASLIVVTVDFVVGAIP